MQTKYPKEILWTKDLKNNWIQIPDIQEMIIREIPKVHVFLSVFLNTLSQNSSPCINQRWEVINFILIYYWKLIFNPILVLVLVERASIIVLQFHIFILSQVFFLMLNCVNCRLLANIYYVLISCESLLSSFWTNCLRIGEKKLCHNGKILDMDYKNCNK